MTNPTEPLHNHHKHCDDLFAAAESAAHEGDWAACDKAYNQFKAELEAHFATEEQAVFPAFEAATGMSAGPTQVMRHEHVQMRDLLGQLSSALSAKDVDGFAGAAETLLIMMQQHNMKEENILYPMCDRALAGGGLDVGSALNERIGAAIPA